MDERKTRRTTSRISWIAAAVAALGTHAVVAQTSIAPPTPVPPPVKAQSNAAPPAESFTTPTALLDLPFITGSVRQASATTTTSPAAQPPATGWTSVSPAAHNQRQQTGMLQGPQFVPPKMPWSQSPGQGPAPTGTFSSTLPVPMPAWRWHGYGAVNPDTAGTLSISPSQPPFEVGQPKSTEPPTRKMVNGEPPLAAPLMTTPSVPTPTLIVSPPIVNTQPAGPVFTPPAAEQTWPQAPSTPTVATTVPPPPVLAIPTSQTTPTPAPLPPAPLPSNNTVPPPPRFPTIAPPIAAPAIDPGIKPSAYVPPQEPAAPVMNWTAAKAPPPAPPQPVMTAAAPPVSTTIAAPPYTPTPMAQNPSPPIPSPPPFMQSRAATMPVPDYTPTPAYVPPPTARAISAEPKPQVVMAEPTPVVRNNDGPTLPPPPPLVAQAPPAPRVFPTMQRAIATVTGNEKHAMLEPIEKASNGMARDIEVVSKEGQSLTVKATVRKAADAEQLANLIAKLPELAPYQVFFELRVAP